MRFLTNFFLFFLFFLAAGLILFLGYTGFLPGVSAFFEANKPKDLGIVFDEAISETANNKIKVKFENFTGGLVPAEGISSIGSHPISAIFTSEELTSLFNEKTCVYYPFSDIQIKINEDSSVEVSGVLLTDRIKNFIEATGGSKKTLPGFIKFIGIFPLRPPFYFQGSLKVEDNKANLDIKNAKVGKFSIPRNLILKYNRPLEIFLENRINFLEDFYIYSLSLNEDYMDFSGTLPDKIIF